MPLDEKSREEKEAYASKIMAEMKLKNEKLKERYKEVQRDRERAEERNSSITLGRNLRKDENKDFSPKAAKPEREWDRGKPNIDSADWDAKHHEYYPPKNSRVYSDRRDRKDDNWRSRPNASSSRPTSSFFSKYHSNKNETLHESSTHRNDGNHFNNRPRSHYSSNPTRNANDSHSQPYHNSKVDDYSQKISSTQGNSDFKRENTQHRAEGADELMWQSGSMIEAQIKFNRIENWVKSINMNHGFAESTDVKNTKEEYKSHGRGRDFGFREKPKKFGMNDDVSNKKSKEQGYFRRNREHVGQSMEYATNSARKKRIRERVSSATDSKNFRDVKRKSATDRPRRKCESDMSDHASSMKESDDTIAHCGSKSNNFHPPEKKVNSNLQDPWGSDIPNNENSKDIFYAEGDEAWIDWGTDPQQKDSKQNSQQLKNKNEYGTKPLQYNSKSKYNRQNEKSNWSESKHQSDKFSRNIKDDLNKRLMHKRKPENNGDFRSAINVNPVEEELNEIWDPVGATNNQEELNEIWDAVGVTNNQEELNEIWDPVSVTNNQEEFNEEWSSEVKIENSKISSPSEHSNNEVLVNQSLNTLESSFDKEPSCLKLDGWDSSEVKGNMEGMKKIVEPVAKQDSDAMKQPLNNIESVRIEENSNDPSSHTESFNADQLEDKDSSVKQHLNSMESKENSEELIPNSSLADFDQGSKPIIKECDRREVSESAQSDSEFQRMDYCNESSDSNSQIVNYDGSSGDTSKSADNMDQSDFENLNENVCTEVVSLNENSLVHDEDCKNEQIKAEFLSNGNNTNEDNTIHSKIDIECTVSTSGSDQDKVDLKLESEQLVQHSNDTQCKNVIPVSDEKVNSDSRGEPDVGGSDEDGWSTVTDEEDDKNDCPTTN